MLVINVAETAQTIDVTYDELIGATDSDESSLTGPGKSSVPAAGGGDAVAATALVGTDVWTGQVVQHISEGGSWSEELTVAHDSRFIIFSPPTDGGGM